MQVFWFERYDRFHAGTDQRRIGAHERHRLALHVRTHESAVGIVVLKERYERGGDRNQLLRRHVDEIYAIARDGEYVTVVARRHQLLGEVAILGERHIGLGDMMLALLDSREIDHLLSDL